MTLEKSSWSGVAMPSRLSTSRQTRTRTTRTYKKLWPSFLRIIRLSQVSRSEARADYKKSNRSKQMKSTTLAAVALNGSIILMLLLTGCQSKKVDKPAVPVKVAAVELNSASSGSRYSATIIPRTQVQLAFKVGGYVDGLRKVRGVDG